MQVVAFVPSAGTGAAAQHGGDAGVQRVVNLLRADPMDVGIDPAGGENASFAGDGFGAGADDDVHVRLNVGIAGLADGGNAAVFEPHVGLDDTPRVDDQRIGDDGVNGAIGLAFLRLTHAVADDLAAAEFHLFAVGGPVVFDLEDEIGVGEADAVAGGGAEHMSVGGPVDRKAIDYPSNDPATNALKP